MDEKPKSIWKKSLKLPGLFLGWLILIAATMFVFLLMALFIGGSFARVLNLSDLTKTLIASLVIATMAFGLWLFIRWLCCWRNVKRSLFALACFATLVALVYAEENWRGKRAWENYRREWEARGEKFDLKDYIPPPVPNEQNLAMTEIMFSAYGDVLTRNGKVVPYEQRVIRNQDTNAVAQLSRLHFYLGTEELKNDGMGYWVKSTVSDLKVLQDWYRELGTRTNLFAVPAQPNTPAAAVLLALGKYDSTIEELRQASQLSECRFPLNYEIENPAEILLPHLAKLKGSSQLLRLRALAELQAGQSDKALADMQLALRLSEGIRTEPFLISHLVRIAITEIMLQPIYEGLANHQWTDSQLVTLDVELAKLDFLADFKFCMRTERAWSSGIIDYLNKGRRYKKYEELTRMDFDLKEDGTTAAQLNKFALAAGFSLMPSGWFEQNKLAIARIHEQRLLRIADEESHQILPKICNEISPRLANWKSSPLNFFVKLMLPAMANTSRKCAREQISVDLARAAIALERYRLVHGEFPASLDMLEPQFISAVPHDVIGGQPLKYHREPGGQFVLYSIGWNEADDGGVTYIPPGGTLPNFDKGDWVWRYPQK
jgi:tetratricopeptide (TPR) repeat protein